MKKIVSVILIFWTFSANAEFLGSTWIQQSELFVNNKLFCSYDQNKSAVFYDSGGYLRVDKWNNGWFRIIAGGGCAVGWFGEHSFVFQQIENDVFDKNGVKVGNISDTGITLNSGTDLSGDTKIQELIFNVVSNDRAEINVKFTHDNQYGYKNFEFKSTLAPWKY